MEPAHRKTKKTYNDPGHAHYLTFSCQERLPLLKSDRACGWVAASIDAARRKHDLAVWAYVIMPEHVHLLICPRCDEHSVERFLFAFKRPVSWKAKQWLIEQGNTEWLARLTIVEGGKKVFRFWQAGGGYDRNIRKGEAALKAVEYIHGNPVRRGLVEKPEDWRWSSAGFYAGHKGVPLLMDPIEM